MREVYLRGFEIAVKGSQPHARMTSCNLLSGVHPPRAEDLRTPPAMTAISTLFKN